MRRAILISILLFGLAPVLSAQRVVDRIVARIEDDIITLSEVRELGRFQQLIEGHSEAGPKLLEKLIEQWIVASEAEASRFPHPATKDVSQELARLEQQSGGPNAFRARLGELGLTQAEARRQLGRQVWLTRYLDYKFRPAAQIDDAQIERYYRDELAPHLTAGGQTVPPLDDVREQIRELLVQRDISQRADRWLEETRPRLHIELEPGELTL